MYGRKINNSENQLAFISFLRLIADDEITPEEAVKAYHGVLQKLKIKPYRSLHEDMKLTHPAVSYGGTPVRKSAAKNEPEQKVAGKGKKHLSPDFKKMSSQEKTAYYIGRLKKQS